MKTPDFSASVARAWRLLAGSAISLAFGLLATGGAQADTGKLRLTGGVNTIEGAAGGGLTPWAIIGTNATGGELGVSAYTTRTVTADYALTGYGVAVGIYDRMEVSLARQNFNAAPTIALNGLGPLGVAPRQHINMDVVGIKLRVAGDAILESDSWMPQIAVGFQYKSVRPGSLGAVFNVLGVDTKGTDFYISATKLFLAQSILVNGTLRSTNANQNGLLGFGSAAPGRNSRSLQPEFSVAFLLRKDLAIGAEYRFKPNNLQAFGAANLGLPDGLREDDWKDIFVAWAPSKNLSLTFAWVDLGRIVPGITARRSQTGFYLSGQVAF